MSEGAATLQAFAATLFHIGLVATVFTHSVWFAAGVGYLWWFQNTLLAHFRETLRQSAEATLLLLFIVPSALQLGVVAALSLLWWYGTSAFPLVAIDAWRISVVTQADNRNAVVRRNNWPTVIAVLAVLAVAVSINFLGAEFSPDLIEERRISQLIGVALMVAALAALLLVTFHWYASGWVRRATTARLNLVYALLFVGWLALPPLLHHASDSRAVRFLLAEAALIFMLVFSIVLERPYVSGALIVDGGENDVRFIVASRMPPHRHVVRWLALLWLPLTMLYVIAAIADSAADLVGALLIFVGLLLLFVLFFAVFWSRSTATAAVDSDDGMPSSHRASTPPPEVVVVATSAPARAPTMTMLAPRAPHDTQQQHHHHYQPPAQQQQQQRGATQSSNSLFDAMAIRE